MVSTAISETGDRTVITRTRLDQDYHDTNTFGQSFFPTNLYLGQVRIEPDYLIAGGYIMDITYRVKLDGRQMWPSIPKMWTE